MIWGKLGIVGFGVINDKLVSIFCDIKIMSIYLYLNLCWDWIFKEVDIGFILDINDNKCENWLIELRGKFNN